MNRYVCIHGHFYQPARENPWLEEIELQDSAYPYHDWNARITAECYTPNSASRILDGEGSIIDILNNFERISFNFGPTVLAWMEAHQPRTYQAILEADRKGQEHYGGHGPAMAQVYNHVIMPLANRRDKITQVRWGIRDFELRFKRAPEGMWLAETAVDLETLEILAEHGILFVVLAPWQAIEFQAPGAEHWTPAEGQALDLTRSYRLDLPSGQSIAVFFYNGEIAQEVAFKGLLNSGETFAHRLASAFGRGEEPQLVHIATDGESYGHHHRYGEMALSYALHFLESRGLATITVYGQFLELHPPEYLVRVRENTSWSCCHGIERWRSNCGCNSGQHPGWHQEWRTPLREALDWLRDTLAGPFEEALGHYVEDPWHKRDEYINVILDRSEDHRERFLQGFTLQPRLGEQDHKRILQLLEMQRNALLMYTSCGWFFDEVTGLETAQILAYAKRVIQLAQDALGLDCEAEVIRRLRQARSNVPEYRDAGVFYQQHIAPYCVDLLRVGAHCAISSLFRDYPEESRIYCYHASMQEFYKLEAGNQSLVIGKALLRSDITLATGTISFAVLHLGDHNVIGGVRRTRTNGAFNEMRTDITTEFKRSNIPEVIRQLDHHFENHNYSLWHLFRDEQRKVIERIRRRSIQQLEDSLDQHYAANVPFMNFVTSLDIPLPWVLKNVAQFVLNQKFKSFFQGQENDMRRLLTLAKEVRKWGVPLDREILGFHASSKANDLVHLLETEPWRRELLRNLIIFLGTLSRLGIKLDLWQAQNSYFEFGRRHVPGMLTRAEQDNREARAWLSLYQVLGRHLKVKGKVELGAGPTEEDSMPR